MSSHGLSLVVEGIERERERDLVFYETTNPIMGLLLSLTNLRLITSRSPHPYTRA